MHFDELQGLAKKIFFNIERGPSAGLRVTETGRGLSVSAGGRVMCSGSEDEKVKAEYRHAIQKLESEGLVERKKLDGEIFRLTRKGVEVAKKIKGLPLPVSNKDYGYMVVLVILNEVKKEAPLPARNLSDEFIIEEINSYLKVSDSVDSQNRKAKEVIFYTFERLKNHQYIAISNFHDTYNGDVVLLPAGERVLDMKVEGFENKSLGSNIKSALRFVASSSVSPSIKVMLDKFFG